MIQLARKQISLPDLSERPTGFLNLTPRSQDACASEGISVSELVYRPLEEFADSQLSPRIVKLRYDYFEAKRKDLLLLAVAARDTILSRKKSSISIGGPSSHSLHSSSTSDAGGWGMLAMEKEKLARFQQGEKKWLENCLKHELSLLFKLESDDQRLSEESNDSNKKMAEESRRIKEMNDRRREIEEQKARVAEAQQELEKEKAKRAFAEHQAELQKEQAREAERKRQSHMKSIREAEQRAQKELEKKKQQDEVWAEKQQALLEMQNHDLERLRIIERGKGSLMERLYQRRHMKQTRVSKSIEKNGELERRRKQELLGKLLADQDRDKRLARAKEEQMEESAKKSLQLMLKRRVIQDESHKKLELRKQDILAHQAEIDQRLAQHEAKRERYLDFKHELEQLRERNKQMNVDRQRKKEEYLRGVYASRVVEKDSKIETIFAHRQELWEVRRKTAAESQRSRDFVKRSIMEMRVKSKIDAKKLVKYVDRVVQGIGRESHRFLANTDEEDDIVDEENYECGGDDVPVAEDTDDVVAVSSEHHPLTQRSPQLDDVEPTRMGEVEPPHTPEEPVESVRLVQPADAVLVPDQLTPNVPVESPTAAESLDPPQPDPAAEEAAEMSESPEPLILPESTAAELELLKFTQSRGEFAAAETHRSPPVTAVVPSPEPSI